MPGKLLRPAWVTRQDLKDDPHTLYMFGDNMLRKGMGGQAGAMRGEPNAVGVPTKWAPGMEPDDFFKDSDLEYPHQIRQIIDLDFRQAWHHMSRGGHVAIPADGLGTGLSQLDKRAPRVLEHIESWIVLLEELAAQND